MCFNTWRVWHPFISTFNFRLFPILYWYDWPFSTWYFHHVSVKACVNKHRQKIPGPVPAALPQSTLRKITTITIPRGIFHSEFIKTDISCPNLSINLSASDRTSKDLFQGFVSTQSKLWEPSETGSHLLYSEEKEVSLNWIEHRWDPHGAPSAAARGAVWGGERGLADRKAVCRCPDVVQCVNKDQFYLLGSHVPALRSSSPPGSWTWSSPGPHRDSESTLFTNSPAPRRPGVKLTRDTHRTTGHTFHNKIPEHHHRA